MFIVTMVDSQVRHHYGEERFTSREFLLGIYETLEEAQLRAFGHHEDAREYPHSGYCVDSRILTDGSIRSIFQVKYGDMNIHLHTDAMASRSIY